MDNQQGMLPGKVNTAARRSTKHTKSTIAIIKTKNFSEAHDETHGETHDETHYETHDETHDQTHDETHDGAFWMDENTLARFRNVCRLITAAKLSHW